MTVQLGDPWEAPVLPTSRLCFRLSNSATPPLWMAHRGLLNGDRTFQRPCYLFEHFCRLPSYLDFLEGEGTSHLFPRDLQVACGSGDTCPLEQRLCGRCGRPPALQAPTLTPRGCGPGGAAPPLS